MNEYASDPEGPAVHVPVTGNRREILRWALGRLLFAPEELAGLRINPHYTLAQKLHVLFSPAPLNCNRRRVTRGIAARHLRFPDDCARLFVKRHYRGLRAAGGYDNDVTINQRRLRIGPFARLPVELFTDALLPLNLAVAGLKAGEVAVRAKRIDEVSVHSRGGPGLRVRRVLIRVTYVADARCPDRGSILS